MHAAFPKNLTDATPAGLKTSLMGGNGPSQPPHGSGVKYSQGTTTPVNPPAEPLAAVDVHGVTELTPDQAAVTRTEAKINTQAKKRKCSNTKVHLMYGRGGGKGKASKSKSKSKSGKSKSGKSGSSKSKKGKQRAAGKGGKKGRAKGGKSAKAKSGKSKKTAKNKSKKSGKK